MVACFKSKNRKSLILGIPGFMFEKKYDFRGNHNRPLSILVYLHEGLRGQGRENDQSQLRLHHSAQYIITFHSGNPQRFMRVAFCKKTVFSFQFGGFFTQTCLLTRVGASAGAFNLKVNRL